MIVVGTCGLNSLAVGYPCPQSPTSVPLPRRRQRSLRVGAASMVGVADRVRRPGGPPLTRWPRAGQSGARKMDLRCTWTVSRESHLDLHVPAECGPACGPGGPPKAEPGTLAPGQRRRRRRLDLRTANSATRYGVPACPPSADARHMPPADLRRIERATRQNRNFTRALGMHKIRHLRCLGVAGGWGVHPWWMMLRCP